MCKQATGQDGNLLITGCCKCHPTFPVLPPETRDVGGAQVGYEKKKKNVATLPAECTL